MKKKPLVVIVGRMNVGKSTLFNRLSEDVKSITLDYAGVTRDVLRDTVMWQGRSFELVDTGGISVYKQEDPLVENVRQRALDFVDKADLVLFVVDGRAGVLPEDEEVARFLREHNKKTLLIVNKIDSVQAEELAVDFYGLYHTILLFISAEHGRGIGELLDEIVRQLPVHGSAESIEPAYRVVFLGRPNVGKSSLLNRLLDQERALVSDIPGTTREALAETIAFQKETIQLTDTPGVRRPRAVSEDLEGLMVKSSFHAVKNSDIVVLIIDANEAGLVDQELKLAFYAFERQYKALILVINKSDLLDPEKEAALEDSLSRHKHLIRKLEVLRISCKTGKNVGKLLPLVQTVWERYSQRLPDDEMTRLCLDALRKRPLVRAQQELHVYKVRQLRKAPIAIGLEANQPQWFQTAQLGFFENILRKEYDLLSVPLKFVVRQKL